MGALPTDAERGAIEISGLVKRFGDVAAVDQLDLSVRAGEFISLLGPSGCGKTTTLRMLAGFEFPDAGSIVISGRAMGDLPPHRREVNTVFQAYALFPHMTVAENIAYGLRQRKTSKEEISRRVSEALDLVRMASMAERRPRQLSGGQQQRVALARALVNAPSVLLLDEPLAALDRKLREEMQIELKLMQAELGITFVFVTHDQGEALSMSDRIAVMRAGKIEQLADPFTVYDSPTTVFVASFIGQQNFFQGTVCDDRAVDSPYGAFRAARGPNSQPARGQAGLVAVRPELITLTDDAAGWSTSNVRPDDNCVRGTLASIAHLGDVIQYVVRLGGHEVLVRAPRSTAPRLQVGTLVECSWSVEDTHLFAAEQSEVVPPS